MTGLTPQASISHVTVPEPPDPCEHCGGPDRAAASVSWEPEGSTAFGYREACQPCLPAVVEHAVADTHLDAEVAVEYFHLAQPWAVAA